MVLAALAAAGCQKTGTKTISINVKVDETKIAAAGIKSPESYDVTISNFATGTAIEAKTEMASPLRPALFLASIQLR